MNRMKTSQFICSSHRILIGILFVVLVFTLLNNIFIIFPHKLLRKDDTSIPDRTLFLVRTYVDHFDTKQVFNIITMIHSLQALENPNWVAYIMNTDLKALPLTGHPLLNIMAKDKRIHFINISARKSYEKWIAGYDIVDEALDLLKDFTAQWMVITNGDNYYHPKFLSHIPSFTETNAVVVGFYTRHNIKGCVDSTRMSSNICCQSRLQAGFADLGGVILSFPRFQREGHRFMPYGAINSQDEVLLTQLNVLGWTTEIVSDCLYSHAPNPYTCTQLGGVWWNSASTLTELSNACLSRETSSLLIKTSIPTPILLTSVTGIKLLTLPEPENHQRKQLLEADQLQFVVDLRNKRIELRSALCQKLKESGWVPDMPSYRALNADLQSIFTSDEEYLFHFWNNGCLEMRHINHAPSEYSSMK